MFRFRFRFGRFRFMFMFMVCTMQGSSSESSSESSESSTFAVVLAVDVDRLRPHFVQKFAASESCFRSQLEQNGKRTVFFLFVEAGLFFLQEG